MKAMRRKPPASLATRIIAGILAAVWLGGGATVIALGILNRAPIAIIVGAAAVWYGLVWVRVVRAGRQLRWNESLFPWRR